MNWIKSISVKIAGKVLNFLVNIYLIKNIVSQELSDINADLLDVIKLLINKQMRLVILEFSISKPKLVRYIKIEKYNYKFELLIKLL